MSAHTRFDEYAISTDPALLDIAVIHDFLAKSYWSPGIPRSIMERAIRNSLCFGLYCRTEQVGFARVITDKATFAYLADVFVLESHRGKGLSKWLMQVIKAHEGLQGLRRFMLITQDAHGLYQQFEFGALANPSRVMEITRPDIYRQGAASVHREDA
jgi:N-acetylglutamate synthase-like GNAT family acetyltransferase